MYTNTKTDIAIRNLDRSTIYQVMSDNLHSFNFSNSTFNIVDYVNNNITHINYDAGELYNDFINMVSSKFGLEINIDSINTPEELYVLAKSLYEMTVSGVIVIIQDFIINYIEFNKNSIIKSLELDKTAKKAKNITTLYCETLNMNDDDNMIITNLDKVIRYILQSDMTTDHFLSISNKGYLKEGTQNFIDLYNDETLVSYYKSILFNNISVLTEMMVNIRFGYYNIDNGAL